MAAARQGAGEIISCGMEIAGGTGLGYAERMLSRFILLAMIFAATAVAQQQEQRMMDRIMNPDRDRANPMGAKAFSAKPFEGKAFRGTGEYTGVKSAQTKEFTTREFLGIRNPWFGKKVFSTEAARDLNRYVLADRGYASRSVETRPARDEGRAAYTVNRTEADAERAFLGRGKSQDSINTSYPSGGALSIDEVRELLNRNR
jgi:hypothetical protein